MVQDVGLARASQRKRQMRASFGCFLKPHTLNGWIDCLNQVLFLTEAELLNFPTSIVFEAGALTNSQTQSLTVPPRIRRHIVNNWINTLSRHKNIAPFLSSVPRTPAQQQLSNTLLQAISDTTLLILTNAYKLRLGRQSAPQLDDGTPLSFGELLTFIKNILDSPQLATIDQIMSAYKQAVDYQLITISNQPAVTKAGFKLKLPARPPADQPPPSITQTNKQDKTITLNLPPFSPQNISQLTSVTSSLKSSLANTLQAQLQIPSSISPKESLVIAGALNRLVHQAIDSTITTYLSFGHAFDPDALSFDIAKQITDRVFTSPIKQFTSPTDRQILILRNRLAADDPAKLAQIIHQSLKDSLEQVLSPKTLKAINQISRQVNQSLPNTPEQARQAVKLLIKNRLASQHPFDPKQQQAVEDFTEKASQFLTKIQPVDPNLVPDPHKQGLIKELAQQYAGALSIPEESLSNVIQQTAPLIPAAGRFIPTILTNSDSASFMDKTLLRYVFTRRTQAILDGQDPYALFLGLTHPLQNLKDQLSSLAAGNPIPIGGRQTPTRPPLAPDSPLYQNLQSRIAQIESLPSDQLAAAYQALPVSLRLYVRWQRFKNSTLTTYHQHLEAIKNLPGFQLSLKLSDIKTATKQAVKGWVKQTKTYQNIIEPVFHPVAAQLAGTPFSWRTLSKAVATSLYKSARLKFLKNAGRRRLYRSTAKRFNQAKDTLSGYKNWVVNSGIYKRAKKYFGWGKKSWKKLASWGGVVGAWGDKFIDIVGTWTDPKQIAFKLFKFLGKQTGKLLVKLLAKLGLSLGSELALASTGVGTVIAALLIAKDLFYLIKDRWKPILAIFGGLLYFLLKFIFSHLVQFAAAAAGAVVGGPVGAVIGWVLGDLAVRAYHAATSIAGGIGNFLGGLASGIANLAASIWGGVAATSSLATGLLTTAVGGTVAVISLIILPGIMTAFIPPDSYYNSSASQAVNITKIADLTGLSQYYQAGSDSTFPRLTNQAAADKANLTYIVTIKTKQDINILRFDDTALIQTKNHQRFRQKKIFSGRKITTQDGQKITLPYQLAADKEIKIAYSLTLDPSLKDSQLVNQARITFKLDDQTQQRVDSFTVLIGDAPITGCFTIANKAKQLANQLGACQAGQPPSQNPACFCPAAAQPAYGFLPNSFHCGDPRTFNNYIDSDQEKNYIQCTEFVNDTFLYSTQRTLAGLCGISSLGNANNWLKEAKSKCPSILQTFQNKQSSNYKNSPQPGDVLVFGGTDAATPYGHVGVVIQAIAPPNSNQGIVTFASANIASPVVTIKKIYGQWGSFSTKMPLLGWLRYTGCQAGP
ncbi:MAG: CHAP domain-containing protein [bacterium]|nr:CHAP domain-containing protein [bacterium]